MLGRPDWKLATLTALLTLTGCFQATRHSNTMIFGTATQFGIKAGTSPASVPEVNIGYSRQEVVVMPLVANISDDGRTQTPCNLASPVQVVDNQGYAVHPCSLVAIKGEARDSYSVLASFGAKFAGTSKADGSAGSGGLAQYFATGMAAQMLALSGGASVVAIGDAAVESAKSPPTPQAVAALFGDQANLTRGVAMRDAYIDFRDKLLAKVTLTDPAQIGANMTAFETAAGVINSGVAGDCTDTAACKKAIVDYDPYRHVFAAKKDAFNAAYNAWSVK